MREKTAHVPHVVRGQSNAGVQAEFKEGRTRRLHSVCRNKRSAAQTWPRRTNIMAIVPEDSRGRTHESDRERGRSARSVVGRLDTLGSVVRDIRRDGDRLVVGEQITPVMR